jgi:hypothetical protein
MSSPIQLSRSERSSLERIIERPCQPGDIPADHEEKFLNYGLVRRNVLLLCVTPLGQCELLRQRFRGKASFAAGPSVYEIFSPDEQR